MRDEAGWSRAVAIRVRGIRRRAWIDTDEVEYGVTSGEKGDENSP